MLSHETRSVLRLQEKGPSLQQCPSRLIDEGAVIISIISISWHSASAEMVCPGIGDLEPEAILPFW